MRYSSCVEGLPALAIGRHSLPLLVAGGRVPHQGREDIRPRGLRHLLSTLCHPPSSGGQEPHATRGHDWTGAPLRTAAMVEVVLRRDVGGSGYAGLLLVGTCLRLRHHTVFLQRTKPQLRPRRGRHRRRQQRHLHLLRGGRLRHTGIHGPRHRKAIR